MNCQSKAAHCLQAQAAQATPWPRPLPPVRSHPAGTPEWWNEGATVIDQAQGPRPQTPLKGLTRPWPQRSAITGAS